jgi:hypothetical protein
MVHIGRNDPLSGVGSSGYAIVHGSVAVDGVLDVKQYVWQHMPVVPVQVAPGVVVLGLLPALPQSGPKVPGSGTPKTKPPSQPPASGPKNSPNTAAPSSPAGKQSPSAE